MQKHKSRTLKQNTHCQLANTQFSCLNPERIALDTLIEISNEPASTEFDSKVLKTEECEITQQRSTEFISKSSSKYRNISKPATAGQPRSRSSYIGSNKKLPVEESWSARMQNKQKWRCREFSKELVRDPKAEFSLYEMQQPISSKTVFIRKMSPSRKKKESFSTVVLPLRSKSKLRVSPQPSDIFSKLDNTIFFNHTINFGNKQIREDLREVLGSAKRSEGRRRVSKDKMNMTSRVNYSVFRHKNKLSIMNIEFPKNQTARFQSFCL